MPYAWLMSAKTTTTGLPALARLREIKGLSLKDVANDLGVAHRSVRRWENGESDPVLGDVRRIAAYFGVTVAYLIGEVNEFGVPEMQRRSQSQPT